MKKSRWRQSGSTPREFTYRRIKTDEGIGIQIFNRSGLPMFKKPLACEPEDALTLVRRLNRIPAKDLNAHGDGVFRKWAEEITARPEEAQKN